LGYANKKILHNSRKNGYHIVYAVILLNRNIIGRDGKPAKNGEFRTAAVTISGHPVSRPDKIERELLKWKENAKVDPIELAAIFHTRFEYIYNNVSKMISR
jgi:Fic family protein